MIDVNLPDFFAAVFLNFRVTPIKVRPAVINVHVGDIHICHIHVRHIDIGVTDVRDVRRLLDNVDVAIALKNAAAGVEVRTKMLHVHEGVTVRPDIDLSVYPSADPDTDLARRFGR